MFTHFSDDTIKQICQELKYTNQTIINRDEIWKKNKSHFWRPIAKSAKNSIAQNIKSRVVLHIK